MSTTIPCQVDTNPMAAEINSVSNHVKATTAAVVTMQSAVIAAETKGANKVCANVNRGFFTLIQSQISQKIANKQSRVEAILMHLSQQKRRLLGIKANMEREYQRIAQRYLRIFTTINKELESRIRNVDQPVFDLVNKHMRTSSNRMNALSAWASTSQTESLTDGQQIMVSKMKHDAQIALEQSTDFLVQIGEQRALASKVLISNPNGNEDKTYGIPVVILVTQNDESGAPRTEIRTPETLPKTNAEEIDNTIRSIPNIPWRREAVPTQVVQEFNRLCDGASMSTRAMEMTKRLFYSSNYETL